MYPQLLAQLSAPLRPLVEAIIERGELFAHCCVPALELMDAELVQAFRGVIEQMNADPALRQEWVEFWLAFAAAHEEDDA